MGFDYYYPKCFFCYDSGLEIDLDTIDHNLCLDCVHNKFEEELSKYDAKCYAEEHIKFHSIMCDSCEKIKKAVYVNMPVCKRCISFYEIKEKKVEPFDIKSICIKCFETSDKVYDDSKEIEIEKANCEICKKNTICICFT